MIYIYCAQQAGQAAANKAFCYIVAMAIIVAPLRELTGAPSSINTTYIVSAI